MRTWNWTSSSRIRTGTGSGRVTGVCSFPSVIYSLARRQPSRLFSSSSMKLNTLPTFSHSLRTITRKSSTPRNRLEVKLFIFLSLPRVCFILIEWSHDESIGQKSYQLERNNLPFWLSFMLRCIASYSRPLPSLPDTMTHSVTHKQTKVLQTFFFSKQVLTCF